MVQEGKHSLSKKQSSSLLLVRPAEYFHGALSGALSQLKIKVSEHAQSYVVGLLTKFLTVENLYPNSEEGSKSSDTTLVAQLASALEEESQEAKRARFRHMGDYSLYIAGFFSDSLNRKLVDVDYYIGMGGTAYEAAAQLHEKDQEVVLFSELAKKFPQFVDALAQVSEESSFPKDPSDLLRKYEIWSKTGSERLAKQLARAGIVLDKMKKTGTDS